MKILLDCVVTTTDPAKCSSNVQFLTFVKQTLERRSDVFFYWLIPDWIEKGKFEATYPQHPNVRYIPIPQHMDRTKEYVTLFEYLDDAIAFNGSLWDFDVLLTMRSGLATQMKMLMESPRKSLKARMKQLWLIEEMVIADFKKTVINLLPGLQDLWTVTGYLAADRVWFVSQFDKPGVINAAKGYLTPSRVMEIDKKVVVTGYASEVVCRLKKPEHFPAPENGKPFCIAHAGRLEKANRIEDINNLMVKTFVMKGAKVELLVCTVTDVDKVFDQSVVTVKHASRDEFWQLIDEKMHVIIKLSDEGGSTMSLLEPMMRGVPAIVGPRKQTEATLGKDYPFIVNNWVEAYAMVKMFYEDYPGMYAKFAKWHAGPFQQMLKTRYQDFSLYRLMGEAVDSMDGLDARMVKERPARKDNPLVVSIVEAVGDRTEFVLEDVLNEMVAAKKLGIDVPRRLLAGERAKRDLIWDTDFNEVRRTLFAFYGWEDASTKVGHYRKKVQS